MSFPGDRPRGARGSGESAPPPAAKILRVIRIVPSQLFRGVLFPRAKQLLDFSWVRLRVLPADAPLALRAPGCPGDAPLLLAG